MLYLFDECSWFSRFNKYEGVVFYMMKINTLISTGKFKFRNASVDQSAFALRAKLTESHHAEQLGEAGE
jgi:hypothetical protein